MINQKAIPVALCLFIDGLDEFEGYDDRVLEWINELSTEPHMKLCVSSRPHTSFMKAFEGEPSLRLQDLTSNDIRRYVDAQLLDAMKSYSVSSSDDTYRIQRMIEEIVKRADGVFLWVVVAVRNIRQGLCDIVDLSELEKEIDDLPVEIEGLYMQIFRRIKPSYQPAVAKIFQIVMFNADAWWATDLTIARFALTEASWTVGDCPLNTQDLETLLPASTCQALRKKIMAHTFGLIDLLEPTIYSRRTLEDATVHVFHRTVKDFLSKNACARQIIFRTDLPETCVRLSIAHGALAYCIYRHRFCNDNLGWVFGARGLHDSFKSALFHISKAEKLLGSSQIHIMRFIFRKLTGRFAAVENNNLDMFSERFPIAEVGLTRGPNQILVDLVVLAARTGMNEYVSNAISLPKETLKLCTNQLRNSTHLCNSPQKRVILCWTAPAENELDDSNYRSQIISHLRMRPDLLDTNRASCSAKVRNPVETYLLSCLRPSLHDLNLREALTMMQRLLRVGADPMMHFRCDGGRRPYMIYNSSCFWRTWLTFLSQCAIRHYGQEMAGKSEQDPNTMGLRDVRITRDTFLAVTEDIIAAGVDINCEMAPPESLLREFPLSSSSSPSFFLFIHATAMFWLQFYFHDCENFPEFTAKLEHVTTSVRRIDHVGYNSRSRREANTLRVDLSEEERTNLLSRIEIWEENGHCSDYDTLRFALREIFTSRYPDMRIDDATQISHPRAWEL